MIHKKSTAGWREIGGKKYYLRSLWEANYARYLHMQKNMKMIYHWEHEPFTFWFNEIKRGVRSYLPDFRITRHDGSIYFVEVKGFMDSKSLTKLKRFKRYYPKEEIHLVDGDWFKENAPKLRLIIPDWEIGENPMLKIKTMAKKKVYV